MASERLLELLNQAIARELQVSIQYIWHHVMATGMRSPEIKDRLKTIAIQEMAHAGANCRKVGLPRRGSHD